MFSIINQLNESKLFPSKSSLDDLDTNDICEMTYLSILALHILSSEESSRDWAVDFANNIMEYSTFKTWRQSGNELYVMLYSLNNIGTLINDDDEENKDKKSDKIKLDLVLLKRWFNEIIDDKDSDKVAKQLMLRLDTIFHIKNGTYKSIRRNIQNWSDLTKEEKDSTLNSLITQMKKIMLKSNLLAQLKNLEIYDIVEESDVSTTSSANIATLAKPLMNIKKRS